MSAAEADAREAARHDELSDRRDLVAAERDRAAKARDEEIALAEEALLREAPALGEHLWAVRTHRALAAADRVCAADDRRQAARDRAQAAEARASALTALRGAHFDDLTGALRRGFGEEAMRVEIERARRSATPLVLVIADVDGLKEVNDRKGHIAGDELLRDLVATIRSNIRSYEPVVRLGGDEFAFMIGGVDVAAAEERCSNIRMDLARLPSGGSITVGMAGLRPDDQLGDLFRRADTALVEARHSDRAVA